MGRKEFLDRIRACRKRLNLAGWVKMSVTGLGIGAAAGIVLQVAARLVPMYYANIYTILALVLAWAAASLVAYVKRSSMMQTALFMDGFGFQERIITAYENLKAEGELVALQRADAMKCLGAYGNRIRIPLMPARRNLLGTIGLLAVLTVLVVVPSPMKDYAKQLHEIRQQAEEKEEEIEEVLEGLEELEKQELTAEQLAALQEMMQNLQSSLTEYQQASSAESLTTASQKLNYKYENISNQLGALAQSLQNGAAVSPVTAEAMQAMETMQAMADKLKEMSGSTGGSQMASNQNGGDGSQNGNGQSGNGQNDNGQNGNGQNGNGQNGNGQNGNGQNGNGQNGNGQNGNGGNGNGSGGDGSGGNGSGNGNGSGRGTGSASNARDYVSVPNAIADSGNLTGNAAGHDNSEFFRAPNGLTWEGTHISYESVIGSYEQNAYEGIAAERYPSGMEDVIKEYFASFN